jgi:uncharacterized membrane protein YdfJ with MMPL/SSD domain/uncharacterized coiled-coil DUF342 family protein
VVVFWVIVVAAVALGVFRFGARTDNDMALPGTEAQRVSDLLAEEFPPEQNGRSPIVFHVSQGTLTTGANRKAVKASLSALRKADHVTSVISPYTRAGKDLMSADGSTAVAQVLLDVNGGQLDEEIAADVLSATGPAREAGIEVEAGGAIGSTLSSTRSRRSEVIGLAAALIILAFTFGSLVAAGMPLVAAIIGLFTGLGLVGLLGHLISIPDTAPTLATMISLGVGIDYALFIVFRHRDQLHAGMEVRESIAQTMATAGSAVVFAGVTVIIALLALLVAQVPILGALGYASALAVLVAVLTAITLLPALLTMLGHGIDRLPLPGRRGSPEDRAKESVWARWVGLVTRHPWRSLLASLLILVPLTIPALSLTLGQEDVGVTPTSTTERRAFHLISDGLGPGANGRLVVAAALDPPATPSESYTHSRDKAERLKRDIDEGQRKLNQDAEKLKQHGAALEAQQAALEAQWAMLRSQESALEAQSADLQSQQAQLLAEKDRLAAQQADLTAEVQELTARGEALAAEIAEVQQELAQATDPAQIAELQAELAQLAGQADEVQEQLAALQERGDSLARKAKELESQSKTLSAQGSSLRARVASLQAQGSDLSTQGAALSAQGKELKSRSAELDKEKRRLEKLGKEAKQLQKDLEEMLTKAGGDDRATDPRLVRLQDAVADTSGVASVAPPRVNESGSTAILTITAATRPADPATADLVRRLRAAVVPDVARTGGMTAYVGGMTAAFEDLATVIADSLPLVIGTVLALSFLTLLLAFRSVLVPLKAILCNLLAVAASFGVLTAVFQWGWGLSLIGQSNPYGSVPIVSYVPLLMFAVLFGMSTDYEVFLISQIFQAHAAGKGPHESVRVGVGSSARVITAAAIIMITVFGSFVLNGDPVIKQFGVGLSVAIFLDATLVRMVIVPATMVLMGRWNWYLPRWLGWLPRTDLPEEAGSEAALAPTQTASEVPS